MNKFNTVKLFDYNIYCSDLEQLELSSKTLINTLNLYSYVMAEKDHHFKKALKGSDIILPDGVGIVVASKIIANRGIKKIAGADLHHYLLNALNNKKGRCFYLGSSERTLRKIIQKLSIEFPEIKAGFYSPPFVDEFNEEECAEMVRVVNEFQPDVLFIGMTAPKQEKWSYIHKDMINAKIICSIGAAFDFYAGTINRPGKIWIDLGLEWLGRFLKEPKRMRKKTVYYAPLFTYRVFKEKIKKVLDHNYTEN